MSRMQRISRFLMLWHKTRVHVCVRSWMGCICGDTHMTFMPQHILRGMNYKAWSLYWTSSGTSNQIFGMLVDSLQSKHYFYCVQGRTWDSPLGPHWNIEMSIFGQKNRPFSFLRDNLDLTLRCWKAAEEPTQQIYQLNETKAGCTELRRGPSHSCGGDGDTPASVFRAGGESEGCAAAEVMHSPVTLSQVTGRRAPLTVRHTQKNGHFEVTILRNLRVESGGLECLVIKVISHIFRGINFKSIYVITLTQKCNLLHVAQRNSINNK